MKKARSQLLLGLVCLILGLMISYQLKATKNVDGAVTPKNFGDLTKQIEALKREKADLSDKVADYEKKIDEIEKSAAKEDETTKQMKSELDRLRILSGVVDVKGRGIIMTLTPSLDVNTNMSTQINHTYLIDIVNELNSAGAEAISINDQRYVSRTQIRNAGSIIVINGERFDPSKPFTIKVIGDPEVLSGAFKLPGSVVDELEGGGIKVKISPQENVEISRFNKEVNYKYINSGR